MQQISLKVLSSLFDEMVISNSMWRKPPYPNPGLILSLSQHGVQFYSFFPSFTHSLSYSFLSSVIQSKQHFIKF